MEKDINKLLVDCINKDDMRSFYKTKEWKHKRVCIFERDHHECQICKRKGKINVLYLNARKRKNRAYIHHIKHLRDYPELALTDSNLITLCFYCHEKEHTDERKLFENKTGFSNEEKW